MKKGILTKMLGGFFFVADCNQNIKKMNIRGRIQKTLYPGDRVGFTDNIIEEVYPRQTLLERPPVANVEQVLIMQSLAYPDFDSLLLDRFLIKTMAAGLKPIIVINKIDLTKKEKLTPPDLSDYKYAGFSVYKISSVENKGLVQLQNELDNTINVITGPSGVGKSTLINTLIESADMETKEVSKKLKRGVHTTRHVELLPLENGGWLADTPGFTSLDIDEIDPQKLRLLYPEFDKYHNNCKFNTCSHTHEPNCAVKDAVERGEISSRRYNSYQILFQELNNRSEIYD